MLLRSPVCWTMPVTTSPTRSMYSSYIISRSASRIRCRITCFAVCAAMRPKLSGVTSSRLIRSSGTCDQSTSRSSSESSVWFFSPVSSSMRSSSSSACSRASSSRRSSRSSGSSIAKTRKSPVSSSSTVACRDAPGVFLYAASSASSSAATSVPLSIPFSRSISRTASTISWLIAVPTLRRSDWPARSRRTVCRPVRHRSGSGRTVRRRRGPCRGRGRSPVFTRTFWPTARSKCACVRSGRSKPGEETSTEYSSRYGRSTSVTRSQSAWSTPCGMVDVDAEALLAGELEREHLDPGQSRLDRPCDVTLQLSLLDVCCRGHLDQPPGMKNGRRAPISNVLEMSPGR